MKERTKTRKWKISKLKEYRQQAAIFGEISEEELNTLASDMKRRGQRTPVEILPNGTIIAGHQRVRAASLLGWTEVEVVVRDDLAKGDDAAVESEFIRDNLVRRHLSPLGHARCIRRLVEIEFGSRPGRLYGRGKEQLKAEIGKQLHMSARNVNRYLLILDTPTAVQQAFDRNEITLVDSGKVALLPESARIEAAHRIEAGEKAKAVLADVLSSKKGGGEVLAAFDHLARALRRDVPRLKGRVDCIPQKRADRFRDVLLESVSLMREVLDRRGA